MRSEDLVSYVPSSEVAMCPLFSTTGGLLHQAAHSLHTLAMDSAVGASRTTLQAYLAGLLTIIAMVR